ncbi:MBL fold metallo-hydrolase [Streptacidiphilus cavernicola]|uniref:MBL fold metallo-hydrolase n=1 Tax=Streptacidiphilus cavernicola TaxID=3342716 RepID=A0ABV6VQ72_9ACTN
MTESATDGLIDFRTAAPVTGSLDVRWIHGVRSKREAADPAIQVHHYDEHTVVLRQSKTVNTEAPFMFLLFGNDRALLLDSGATEDPARFPLRETVDGLIDAWLAEHPRPGYELVVAHTHGHNDHVAGDAQFADRPATTVVPREVEAVQEFFGLTDWLGRPVAFDLGGRVLQLMGTPGHHAASVTTYDPWTGILFTGDTVLPGRLYVKDFPAFTSTLHRLVAFTETHSVTHVLGCHVEMSTRPGQDFPLGAPYQPGEVPPQLTVAQLTAVRDAADSVADRPGVHGFDDFIIYHGMGFTTSLRLLARGLAHRLSPRRRVG